MDALSESVNTRTVIAIGGAIKSGKSTLGRTLREAFKKEGRSVALVETSSFLAQLAEGLDSGTDRESLQNIYELCQDGERDGLESAITTYLMRHEEEVIIIAGLRMPGQAECILDFVDQTGCNVILIYLSARWSVRHARNMQQEGVSANPAEFIRLHGHTCEKLVPALGDFIEKKGGLLFDTEKTRLCDMIEEILKHLQTPTTA